jgi:hypothetical protein
MFFMGSPLLVTPFPVVNYVSNHTITTITFDEFKDAFHAQNLGVSTNEQRQQLLFNSSKGYFGKYFKLVVKKTLKPSLENDMPSRALYHFHHAVGSLTMSSCFIGTCDLFNF